MESGMPQCAIALTQGILVVSWSAEKSVSHLGVRGCKIGSALTLRSFIDDDIPSCDESCKQIIVCYKMICVSTGNALTYEQFGLHFEVKMAGLYFEQFEVGKSFRHEIRRTVTDRDNLRNSQAALRWWRIP